MDITILTPDQRIISLNVNHCITVEDLKSLIEDESGVPPQLQQLLFDGKEMRNSKKLRKYGVRHGGLLVMTTTMVDYSVPSSDVVSFEAFDNGAMEILGSVGSSIWFNPDGSAKEPLALKHHILNNADMMERIFMYDPELAGVLREDGTMWLQLLLRTRHCQRAELPRRKQNAELALLRAANESDDVRRKLKAAYPHNGWIIDEWNPNLEHITSYTPRQKHLRVDVKINGKSVKAVIDTGSPISVMSTLCTKICGLVGLIKDDDDKEDILDASGIKLEILGQINIVPIEMQNVFFLGSFSVCERIAGSTIRCVFGRNFLLRNECIIDTKNKVMKIEGEVNVPFVSLGKKTSPADLKTEYSEVSSSRYSRGSSRRHEFRAKVYKLIELGFPKEAAINALKVVGGDEQVAAEFLFGR